MFQIWSHFLEKMPDSARKCEKSIEGVELWRALTASPSIVSGRASWHGLTDGVAFKGLALVDKRRLDGSKLEVAASVERRERKKEKKRKKKRKEEKKI